MDKVSRYKHLQLRQYFIGMTLRGEIDKALPSERALSEMFQVSRVTVRASLAAMVKEKYLVRYPRRGYFVNPGNINEIVRSRKLIGLLFYSGDLAFYDDDAMNYLHAITAQCLQSNILLQILNPSPASMYTDIINSSLDGLLWINADDKSDIFEKFSQECSFPVVGLFNKETPRCGNYIFLDHNRESYLRTQYLITCGAKRIVTYDSPQILEGYKEALAQAGIPFDPVLVVPQKEFNEKLPDLYDKHHADAFSLRVLDYPVLEQFIQERHLSVPGDIQYIFDNFHELHERTITVKPFREIAQAMVSHLLDVISGKSFTLQKCDFSWQIKAGNSTFPPVSPKK